MNKIGKLYNKRTLGKFISALNTLPNIKIMEVNVTENDSNRNGFNPADAY